MYSRTQPIHQSRLVILNRTTLEWCHLGYCHLRWPQRACGAGSHEGRVRVAFFSPQVTLSMGAQKKLWMFRKFQPGFGMLLDSTGWAVLLCFYAKCLHLSLVITAVNVKVMCWRTCKAQWLQWRWCITMTMDIGMASARMLSWLGILLQDTFFFGKHRLNWNKGSSAEVCKMLFKLFSEVYNGKLPF